MILGGATSTSEGKNLNGLLRLALRWDTTGEQKFMTETAVRLGPF
jgi:hypothetical protein